jgi:D-glycero-D-manno-heptose 1,7-bisphosphate phosphatase
MRLVILDRDGVINEDSDAYVKSPDEWIPIPGSLEAIARLNASGWRVVVASNQSGLGRGLFDITALNAVHDKLHRELAQVGGQLDGLFFCPHAPEDGCGCRKPKTGLLLEIAERFNIELEGLPCIGDSLRDLEAARTVSAQPILVLTGKGAETRKRLARLGSVKVYPRLAEAVDALLSEGA